MRLQEASRQELISKSKRGANYALTNQSKGKNRWERKKYSKVATTVASFNRIDMNEFFKQDILTFEVQVKGETDVYFVTIKFVGALNEISKQVKRQKNLFDYRAVLTALIRTYNTGNVFISCTCDDWKYRFSYQGTKNKYNSGEPEMRPANITNPNDDKGAGCKHSLLVLSNQSWIMKVASVIVNYVNYCKDHLQRNYADYIFPKIYDMPYQDAVQLTLFDEDELKTDVDTINLSNALGARRGQFQVGNKYRFQKKPKESNELGLDFKED